MKKIGIGIFLLALLLVLIFTKHTISETIFVYKSLETKKETLAEYEKNLDEMDKNILSLEAYKKENQDIQKRIINYIELPEFLGEIKKAIKTHKLYKYNIYVTDIEDSESVSLETAEALILYRFNLTLAGNFENILNILSYIQSKTLVNEFNMTPGSDKNEIYLEISFTIPVLKSDQITELPISVPEIKNFKNPFYYSQTTLK